jgi:hypothetical protein
MPALFFARIANKVHGPFDGEKLKKLAAAGKLTRDDAISKDGKTGWTLAGNVKGLFPPAELLVADPPRPIETVIRREPAALARAGHPPAIPIPQAIPAPAAQPTIVYMQATAGPAPQQNVQTTVIVHAARPHNTCATLAAGLGLLSLIAAFVPVLGLIVLPAAGLTLLLALFGLILALTRGGTGLIGSLGGGLLAVIAIPVAMFSTAAGVGGAIQAVEQARQQARQAVEQEAPAAEPQPAEPAAP